MIGGAAGLFHGTAMAGREDKDMSLMKPRLIIAAVSLYAASLGATGVPAAFAQGGQTSVEIRIGGQPSYGYDDEPRYIAPYEPRYEPRYVAPREAYRDGYDDGYEDARRDSHRRSRPSLVGGIVGGALDTAGLATHGALGLANGIVGSVLGR